MKQEGFRKSFRYLERLRVRWAEVDMQKIVFNGHYLTYVDTAVAGYWRALALPYHDTMEALHGDLYVRKATLEYEGSARYDDVCHVGIRCARIGNSSMGLQAAVFRGEQRLVHGELVYVFADPATQTSRPVPAALREVLLGFEAGRPMMDVRMMGWDTLASALRPLRRAVLVDELGAPEGSVEDGADASALHAAAFNRLGVLLGGARLEAAVDGRAALGRLAVLPSLRHSGAGRLLVQTLLQAARDRGDQEVTLQAQAEAVPFFEREGFSARGERFELADVPHLAMARRV